MPKVQFKSNARPSMFAYPPPLEEKKNLAKEKVETAVLSITAKHRRKEAEKKKEEKMEVVSCRGGGHFRRAGRCRDARWPTCRQREETQRWRRNL